MTGKFLCAAVVATVTACPAIAAVTVVGSSSARMCYLSAESRARPDVAAMAECDRALTVENLTTSDRVATLVNRGILRQRLDRIEEAIGDFDAAIALDAGEAEAYLNKGMVVLRRGDGWEQAVSLFDSAIGKQTRRPEIAYYGRGIANEMGGRIAAAYQDYRQASVLAPKWAEPKMELARFTVHQK